MERDRLCICVYICECKLERLPIPDDLAVGSAHN